MISFRLGRTCVFVSFSFFAVLCLYFQLGQDPRKAGCLWAALLHEGGHLAAFALQGAPPQEIHFGVGGIRLVSSEQPLSLPGELATLTAGALVNFVCCGLFYLLGQPVGAALHLCTGLFSLLPVPGLDGGEIAALLIESRFPQSEKAAARCLNLSAGVLCALSLAACWRYRAPGFGILAAAILCAALCRKKA